MGCHIARLARDARIRDIREIHPIRRRAICLMAYKGWSREFEDPIPLPGGRKLITLRDAADYMTALPKKEAAAPEWQAAIEALMLVAKTNGPPCSHVSASCGH
jgi:hypothetical protein